MATQKMITGSEGVKQLERAMRVYSGEEKAEEPTLEELTRFIEYIQEFARRYGAAIFLRSERCPVRLVFFPSGGIYEYQKGETPRSREAVAKEVLLGIVHDNLPRGGYLSRNMEMTYGGLLYHAYRGEGVEFFVHYAYSEALGG